MPKKKSHEEFVKEVAEKMPGYTVYGMYKNDRTKIEIGHDECGHRWFIRPSSFLHGKGCPKCAGNIKKSHEEFVKEVAEKMPGYTVYGMYKGARTKIEIGHDKCGYRWFVSPHGFLRGYGCPKCNESKGESTIAELLKKHNIDFVYQHTFDDCRRKNKLPFDFYAPIAKVAIEYDGVQHFLPIEHFGGIDAFNYRIENDRIKTDYCAANGIKLVRIRFDDDIEKILGEALGW